MLAEEGESPARSRPGPAQKAASKVAQRPDHLARRHGDRDGGSQRVLLDQPVRQGMVRPRFADVRKTMPEVGSPRFRATGSPGRPSCRRRHRRIATIPISPGVLAAGQATSLASCAFSVELAALRHAAPRSEGLQALALGVVEGDRAAGGLAPGGLGATVLAGSQRHHDAVEGDQAVVASCGMPSASRMLPSGVSGPQGSPSIRHAQGQAQPGCSADGAWRRLRKERRRGPGRAVTHHQQTELGRRPRQVIVAACGPGSRRPAPAMPRSRRCEVTRSPVGHRTERGHDRLRRHRDPAALPVASSIREASHRARLSMTAPMTSRLELSSWPHAPATRPPRAPRGAARNEAPRDTVRARGRPPRRPEEAGRERSMDEGGRRRGYCRWERSRCWVSRHGIVPPLAVRSVPTFRPARPCRRDKILQLGAAHCHGDSTVFGRSSRHKKRIGHQ